MDDFDEKSDSKCGEDSKADSKQSLTGLEVLLKVEEYFYGTIIQHGQTSLIFPNFTSLSRATPLGDDELADYFQNYALKKCGIIDLESEEYKLEYTELYHEYRGLFEKKLEYYIEKELQGSVTEMFAALKSKMDDEPNSSEAFFGQILLAVSDFDIFMTMMRCTTILTASHYIICLSLFRLSLGRRNNPCKDRVNYTHGYG